LPSGITGALSFALLPPDSQVLVRFDRQEYLIAAAVDDAVPVVDTYRTLYIEPSPEVRAVFESSHELILSV